MSDEVVDRIKKVITNHLGVKDEKVTENAKFIDEAAEKIVTVKDAIELIKNKT